MKKSRIVLVALAILMVFAAVSCKEPHVHEFGDWEVTTPATCTEAGIETRVCECGENETRDIAALGHSLDGEGKCLVCDEEGLFAAKIGENNFKSLAAAIESITDDSVATTITMVNNVSKANGISVKSGKNLVVDFAGHTYCVEQPGEGSSGTKTQAFQLLKDSTIVFKNGTIGCTEDCKNYKGDRPILMIIQNYSNLTLDNMTIDGSNIAHTSGASYVVSVNHGNVEFKDTKIVALDGDVAFDSCKFSSYSIPTIKVSGSSQVAGTVELSGGKLVYQDGTLRKDQISVYTGFNYDVKDEEVEGVKWNSWVAK